MFSGIYNAVTGKSEYGEAPYTSVQLENKIEKRVYPSANWVCTKTTTTQADNNSQSTLFRKLFKYIQGENDGSNKIAMTVPVTTQVITNEDSVESEMGFYIGSAYQSNPPAPTNSEVYILPQERTIYTRTIGGFMNNETWKAEAEDLKKELEGMGISFDKDRYFKVGYDAPFKFWNRRNEVWYPAK